MTNKTQNNIVNNNRGLKKPNKSYNIALIGQNFTGKIILAKLLHLAQSTNLNLNIALYTDNLKNEDTKIEDNSIRDLRNFALRAYSKNFLEPITSNLAYTPVHNLVNVFYREPLIEQANNLSYMVSANSLQNQLQEYIKSNEKFLPIDKFEVNNLQQDIILNNQGDLIYNNKKISADIIIVAAPLKLEPSKYIEHNYKQTALVFNIAHSLEHNNTAYEFFTNYGTMALLPHINTLSSNVVFNVNNKLLRGQNICKNSLLNIINTNLGGALGQITMGSNVTYYPLILKFLKNITHNNLIFIGDSALKLHPIAGQALNGAIKNIELFLNIFIKNYKLGLPLNFNSNFTQYAIAAKKYNISIALFTHFFAKLHVKPLKFIHPFLKFSIKHLDSSNTLKHKLFNTLVAH